MLVYVPDLFYSRVPLRRWTVGDTVERNDVQCHASHTVSLSVYYRSPYHGPYEWL